MSFTAPTNFRQIPPVWEIAQPFNIDNTGTVAYDTDPVAWARNHILAVLLTSPGERVMRPGYGVGLYAFVWENGDPIIESQMISNIMQTVSLYEPNITIQECEFVPQPDFSGIVNLQISFSVGMAPTIHTVTFTLGGTGIEVASPS